MKKILTTLTILFGLILFANFVNAEDYAETITPNLIITSSSTATHGDISLIKDNDISTFYGIGESQHHGGSANVSLTYIFPNPVNLENLSFKREFWTGGSGGDTERQIEKVIVWSVSGKSIVYDRNVVYGGSSGMASGGTLDTKFVQGPFNEITKIEFNFYASSSGGHSDRLTRIRLYEITINGSLTLDYDKDNDGVLNDTDCDDNNASIWQLLKGYIDSDRDGFGASGSLEDVCSGNNLPDGRVGINSDCNDNNALINPDANELCDGQDNNCDGIIDEGCGTITCSSDTECGNPYSAGTPNYCWLGNVYQDFLNPKCNNPGTITSFCSEELSQNIFTTCNFGCDNGACIPDPAACSNDNDCPIDYLTGLYCNGNNVVITSHDFWCSGTCQENITTTIVESCQFGCDSGSCLPPPAQCTLDSDCGNETYSENYCDGNSVFKNHTIPECENGTCSFNETKELVENCDSGYECNNGACEKEDDDDDNEGGKRSSNGLCGDLICDALNGENKITCPEDCDESFPQNQVQQLEPVILQDISEFTSNENNPSTTWWIISIILIILVIILITFILRIF